MTQRKTHLALLLTLSIAGTLSFSNTAHATDLQRKSDSFLLHQASHNTLHGWAHVIVRFTGTLGPTERAQLDALHVDVTRNLAFIRSAAAAVPMRNLEQFASLPFVEHLSADLAVKKTDEFTVESSGADVAFTKYGLDGGGIGVAVIDSGIGNQGDLDKNADGKVRLQKGINFAPGSDGKVDPSFTADLCGHGTHVAGIVAGNGKNSSDKKCYRTFFGIARGASLIPVRVLDSNGEGTVGQVLSGIQWVLQNRAANNIRVINLSLGHPVGESYTTDPLCQAVEAAWKSGMVVVCSAGNSGRLQDTADSDLDNEGYGSAYGSIQSPGNDPSVITVGAMKAMDMSFNSNGSHSHNRANDRVTTYSSRGPSRLDLVLKPDIMAPGNKIVSLEASDKCTLYLSAGSTNDLMTSEFQLTKEHKNSNRYFRLSGTSMAAPVVSGAALLLLQKDSTLTPDTIKARLMLSADKWKQPDGMTDPCTFGAGYLNIAGALSCTAVAGQPATSPTLLTDSNGNVLINMDRAIWGHDASGAAAIWGVSGVNDLRAIWGHDTFADGVAGLLTDSRAIWGHSVIAERAIWGHTVWEDRAIWGHSAEGVDLTTTAIDGE